MIKYPVCFVKMIKIIYKLTLRPLYYQIYQQIYFNGKLQNAILHIISLGVSLGGIFYLVVILDDLPWSIKFTLPGLGACFVVILIYLQVGIIYFFIRKIKKDVIFSNLFKPFSASFFPVTIIISMAFSGMAFIGIFCFICAFIAKIVGSSDPTMESMPAIFSMIFLLWNYPFSIPYATFCMLFSQPLLFWILFNQIMAGIAISKVLSISPVKIVLIVLFSLGICFCLLVGYIEGIQHIHKDIALLFRF